jgi:demethylmenaquinone methyltransferase/2-methoxy-6-polyprenyl-1,4-benzoquinol methylase
MAANLSQAIAHYRELAPRYDRRTRWINRIRLRTIAALGLREGDTVLDAGCGTGWCLPHLAAAVGATGRVIGFDPSPEMLEIARSRADPHGRIALLRATAEDVVLPVKVDAILFSYTHDLIRSKRALDNLLGQARPGARVAATSTKLYAPWLAPLNWYLRVTHRAYITNFDSFDAPWSLLAARLDDVTVETSGWTQHYVATGRLPAPGGQDA